MHCPSEGAEAIGRLMRLYEKKEKEEQERLERRKDYAMVQFPKMD